MYVRENTKFLNENIIDGFSEKEKEILFEDLMNMYFRKNFGTLTKAELETYLFSFYIEHLLDNNIPFDDYTIGRDLGITQSRVRALKERKELKYPRHNYDWKQEFLLCARNAKYDEVKRLIKFQITDVNVIKDARHFFEINGQYDEFQLNPKLFQCSLEAFIEMGNIIAQEANEEFVFSLENQDKVEAFVNNCDDKNAKDAIAKFTNGLIEDGLKELFINCSKEVILQGLNLIMPGSGSVVNGIFEVVKKALER